MSFSPYRLTFTMFWGFCYGHLWVAGRKEALFVSRVSIMFVDNSVKNISDWMKKRVKIPVCILFSVFPFKQAFSLCRKTCLSIVTEFYGTLPTTRTILLLLEKCLLNSFLSSFWKKDLGEWFWSVLFGSGLWISQLGMKKWLFMVVLSLI